MKSKHDTHARKPHATTSSSSHPWFFYIILVVLAGVPFGLGKYFEFNSPSAFDSGAYVHSAAHILAGAKIGVGEKPSAQLGTLLVNLLGVSLFGYNDIGPKLIQMILQIFALILMFFALRRIFGTGAAGLGVLIASVYLSCPLLAKFGNVKEQFMIAFMVMGVSCFVYYLSSGRWWWCLLAGALLAWAPLFKQTGLSAVGGVGFFVLLQPVLKHRTWKQMGYDIGLLLAGVVIGIGPLYLWILIGNIQLSLPYAFVWKILVKPLLHGGGAGPSAVEYVSTSRQMVPFSEQWPRVLRYYGLLILPISLALGSIGVRLTRWLRSIFVKKGVDTQSYESYVLLFAIWWVLDMAFVWISPRSYEQYYLPLNASAAMLSGYLVALYAQRLRVSIHKGRWVFAGLGALILMVIMSWPIFFGVARSPYSGMLYRNRLGQIVRQSGYVQKMDEIRYRRQPGSSKAPWLEVATYIRNHSGPEDRIYVWGWFPGIYVYAHRFSAASTACTITRIAPAKLKNLVRQTLTEFEHRKPKFIVDTRKRHIPVERPPYELWPIVPRGFMGAKKSHFLETNPKAIKDFDQGWSSYLRSKFGEDEAKRFEILAPFRAFIRTHYRVVNIFGGQVLFELKGDDLAARSK